MKEHFGRQSLREINAILWADWNPIGCGVPEDEYHYAPGVLRLLLDGADQRGLANHLQSLAKDSVACAVDEHKAMAAAGKLLAIKVR